MTMGHLISAVYMKKITTSIFGLVSAFMLVTVFTFAGSVAASANPFKKVAGNWRSAGATATISGNRERIKCRARYKVPGKKVGFTLKCSGPGYFINVRVSGRVNGSSVSGQWSESKYAKSGSLNGSATKKSSSLSFWGGGVSGNMYISFKNSRRHTMVINAAGNKIVIPLKR